jgi:hypothetical protein
MKIFRLFRWPGKGLMVTALVLALMAGGLEPGWSRAQTPGAPPPEKKEEPKDLGKSNEPLPKAPEMAPLQDKSRPAPRLRSMTPEARPSSTRRMGGMEIRAKEGEEKE